jgi:hypothetical protein
MARCRVTRCGRYDSSRDSSSRPLRSFIGVFLTLMAFLPSSLSAQTSAPIGPPKPQPKDFVQSFFVPLVSLEDPSNTELLIGNRSAARIQTPTLQLYTLEGQPIPTKNLILNPGEFRYMRISDLLLAPEGYGKNIGGLTVDYTGRFMEVVAQVALLATETHTSIDMPATDDMEFASQIQNAAWYAPPESVATLALGNASAADLKATLHFASGRQKEVLIAPHATKLVLQPAEFKNDVDAVAISYTGQMAALRTEGFVIGKNGYTSSIRFYDPMMTQQPNLYATNVPVTNSDVHITLFNPSQSQVVVTPKAISSIQAGASLDLPSMSLKPQEVVSVDVTTLQERAESDPAFGNVAVMVSSTGEPGSLVGHLSSTQIPSSAQKGSLTIDVPLRDSGTIDKSAGIYPLRWREGEDQVVSITNTSPLEARFLASILYSGGHYAFPVRSLQPGESAQFNVAEIRDQQTSDAYGHKLPADLSQAAFHWMMSGSRNGQRLIGRSEVIDQATRRVTSLSCGSCPTDEVPIITQNYTSPVSVNSTVSFAADHYYTDGYGNTSTYPDTGDQFYPSPSGIESISEGSGDLYYIAGQTAGTATVSYTFIYDYQTWDGTECLDDYGQTQESWQDQFYDPTPNITGITSPWQAGTSNSVTISGSGFGTNQPCVKINDPSGNIPASCFYPPSYSDTSISLTVSVPAATPLENVTVTVTSTGYGGQGFTTSQGNSGISNAIQATINAIQAPTPQIIYKGSNIVGSPATNQRVTIGQQISLSSSVNVPPGTFISTQSWTIQGTYVGGYSASTSSGAVIVPVLTNPTALFYWTYAGSNNQINNQVTYNYCLNNNSCTSGTATFEVHGPNITLVSAPVNPVEITPNLILQAGDPASYNYGIRFTVQGTAPLQAGPYNNYEWVQLPSQTQFVISCAAITQGTACTGIGTYSCVPKQALPALDTVYPYVAGETANDSPATETLGSEGEYFQSISFQFKMYLLWDPALNADGTTNCSPASSSNGQTNASTCTGSIPVPIGSFSWGASGAASNGDGRGWVLSNPNPSAANNGPSFNTDSSFPQWNSFVTGAKLSDTSKVACTKQ